MYFLVSVSLRLNHTHIHYVYSIHVVNMKYEEKNVDCSVVLHTVYTVYCLKYNTTVDINLL